MAQLKLTGTRVLLERARLTLRPNRSRRYLFILSHMRSYTSLLCHILNSNPDVTGYVELHRPYRNRRDLFDLEICVSRTAGRPEGRYALDKVLHNNAPIAPALLGRDDVFTVYMIREPEQTIRSTVAMVRRKGGPQQDWKHDPAKVARYYVRRLQVLTEMAEVDPARSVFFDAERLVDDTVTILDGLSRFLQLATPLTDRYETFSLTGEPGFGDPGRFIGAGQVVRERSEYDSIEIPAKPLSRALDAYAAARASLVQRCETVLGVRTDQLPGQTRERR
jgi:hypothetical protein